MMDPIEFRLRTKINPETLAEMVGKILTPEDVRIQLTGPTVARKPDGKLLAIYLPGALLEPAGGYPGVDAFWPLLHELRKLQTTNRGYAGGSPRIKAYAESTRTRGQQIASGIIGSFDALRPYNYCRLTAFSGSEWEKYSTLFPLFGRISDLFREKVPDRWSNQMQEVQKVHPDWIIPGTAFTTITVNNSYPTGVHTDKGDLDAGFSTLSVLRRGDYRGGFITFPEYGVGVDMQHGDLLLMDAHEWHGNTEMGCNVCGEVIGGTKFHDSCEVERISVVSYFRTKMVECGSAEEEAQRAKAWSEHRISMSDRLIEEQAEEAVG